MTALNIKSYPLDDGFICSLTVDGDVANSANQKSFDGENSPTTVIILDRSGSMGDSVEKITNQVLPIFFEKLSYHQENEIYLLPFDNECELIKCKVGELSNFNMRSRGGTYMSTAVQKFGEIYQNFDKSKPIRLLTISDGEVFDLQDVVAAGAQLYSMTSSWQTPINSQAVRLFTSSSQPDTTALCTLLQINNTVSSKLLDISAYLSSEQIAQELADLFLSDTFSYCLQLESESKVFKNYPWDLEATDKVSLTTGENVFWMTKETPKKIESDGTQVDISVQAKIDREVFYKLLDRKIDFVIDRIKILKVIGTDESNETVKSILQYFDKTESLFETLTTQSFDELQLNGRVKKMITSRRKRISFLLSSIANDDNISKLNSAQKADYLRKTEATTSTSRGLAKRAAKEGLNFDEIARSEISAMAKNFHEISNIDDSNHLISFYSQDTTFGGIKALVELSENECFESLDAQEILEILNLVGVACKGPIGDFPDPSTWKADEMFLGWNVSVSDILVSLRISNGNDLEVPGEKEKKITNVIPVFDDARIGIFMKKYASSLLEYNFSIGMRRMIAEVPMTIGYTMCAGVQRMIFELNNARSSLHIEIFKKLVKTFDGFVGRYFDHVDALLKPKETFGMSFYLANNGTSNLMAPLIRLFKKKEDEKLKLVPSILRALFAFEVWQIIRRKYKNKENSEEIAKKALHKLLGIDIKKHKVNVGDPFSVEQKLENINFYDSININMNLSEISDRLHFAKLLALFPSYLKAGTDASIDSFENIPSLSDEFVLKALDIDYDYESFIFLNVYQALRYTTRSSREDSETLTMKTLDLKYKEAAINEVKNYIRSQFKSEYLSDVAAKRKYENEIMGEEVADKILSSEIEQEMISIWRDGITKSERNYKIENPSSAGFKSFRVKLCDPLTKVPHRVKIFRILLLGVDDTNSAVWNRGGVCFLNNLRAIKRAFLKFGTADEWSMIYNEIKGKGKHIYRDKDNFRGHGNLKPSYWAMGYSDLIEFKNAIPAEEFEIYCLDHSTCCGVRHLTTSDRSKVPEFN